MSQPVERFDGLTYLVGTAEARTAASLAMRVANCGDELRLTRAYLVALEAALIREGLERNEDHFCSLAFLAEVACTRLERLESELEAVNAVLRDAPAEVLA